MGGELRLARSRCRPSRAGMLPRRRRSRPRAFGAGAASLSEHAAAGLSGGCDLARGSGRRRRRLERHRSCSGTVSAPRRTRRSRGQSLPVRRTGMAFRVCSAWRRDFRERCGSRGNNRCAAVARRPPRRRSFHRVPHCPQRMSSLGEPYMTNITASAPAHSSLMARLFRLRSLLESVPYSVLAIPLRLAVATIFWNSGMTKLASWDTTIQLFADEYRLPLFPPELAACFGGSVWLGRPVFFVFGLLSRAAAFVLLRLPTGIAIFVF